MCQASRVDSRMRTSVAECILLYRVQSGPRRRALLWVLYTSVQQLILSVCGLPFKYMESLCRTKSFALLQLRIALSKCAAHQVLSVILYLLSPCLSAGTVSAPETVPLEQLLPHKSGHQHPVPRDGAGYVAVCVEWPPRYPIEWVKPLRSGGGHRPPRHWVTLCLTHLISYCTY